jgi:hypothetical protein
MPRFDRNTLIGRRETLQRQLQTHQRSLWHLEEQQARYGISTPPHVAIGIEDEQEEIKRIKAELAEVTKQLKTLPFKPEALDSTLIQGKKKLYPTVFISYSHKDEMEKKELVSHLEVLQGEGMIDVWVDDRIGAGRDWAAEIDRAMSRAGVAILLITKNFLTSKFILQTEIPRLLKRRKREGLVVFPVIARPCAWRQVEWLARMNVRPKNGVPVWREGGRYVDEELTAVAEEVADIVEQV